MPAVKSLTISYDALNEKGTFSQGDVVTGQAVLSLSKETKAQGLFVKAKGDANVHWTEKSGDRTHTYSALQRYFKLKQFLIPEDSEAVLPEGNHVFKFSFRIPSENMPSSFKGNHGQIVYKLVAKLSRSWRMNSTAEKELNFVSKSFSNFSSLLSQQVGTTEKKMGIFSRGQVHMEATVNKTAYAPGESMLIFAKVNNASSRDMTPKFSLTRSVEFRAQGDRKNEEYTVQKVVDKVISSYTQHEVKCEMRVPTDEMPSIENCDIISVTHQLKVYLDISFAFDPEIIFPVVISQPTLMFGAQNSGNVGPGAFGGPTNSDFPPPAMAIGPYPAPPPSGAYPPQPPPMHGSYNNPVPQGPSPCGSSYSSSSSVLHPPPAAPAFHMPPSGLQVQPPFSSVSPSAPTFNPMPSAPDLNTDFLSQTNDAPPAYTLLFPSPSLEKSDTK
ncbi:arrestin domain-containing protein 3 isoform X2 [Girardinichthys multiradiatus]|uniref:arrestin domain-containing protein 3 isoform X2 n=1 Tax=Girardinichthys multiradiatus TaxID=208333 RepID=UPI001FAB68A4|nr:arrestin domain-containing protein 3 isoform X2 [Girardinichthys multiradiatus]